MKRLVLETTAPFQGLPELVAYDEGLFAREGLLVEWADREAGVAKKTETDTGAVIPPPSIQTATGAPSSTRRMAPWMRA